LPANLAAITTSVLVVFGVTPAALVLFATESVPVDVTARIRRGRKLSIGHHSPSQWGLRPSRPEFGDHTKKQLVNNYIWMNIYYILEKVGAIKFRY
jgi:hypothetical protein